MGKRRCVFLKGEILPPLGGGAWSPLLTESPASQSESRERGNNNSTPKKPDIYPHQMTEVPSPMPVAPVRTLIQRDEKRASALRTSSQRPIVRSTHQKTNRKSHIGRHSTGQLASTP